MHLSNETILTLKKRGIRDPHFERRFQTQQFDARYIVRQLKSPTTDAVFANDLVTNYLDVPGGRQSVSASLGAVTSRRLKDEVNVARKLELVAVLFSDFLIHSYVKIIDIDVLYIFLFFVCNIFYGVDILCSSVSYI